MSSLAKSSEILKKRVLRLLGFDQTASGAREIQQAILPLLETVGAVALIGGAVRDLARGGRREFKSDLDFVVHSGDPADFKALMIDCKARPNRFGGYALNFDRWKVDAWHIEDTWAKTSGHRRVESLPDLLNCTFFDWDSAIFEIRTRRIFISEGYFDSLRLNVMDLQLETNPNPTGSLVRALRRAALWGVHFGPSLTSFARTELRSRAWGEFVTLDARAFNHPVLRDLDHSVLLERLDSASVVGGKWITTPVPRGEIQLELPLEPDDSRQAELRLPA
jgi:hypothetical protein